MTTTVLNPYLAEVARYPCRCPDVFRFGRGTNYGCTFCVADDFGPESEKVRRWEVRERLVKQYAYAIPDDRAIAALVALSPLVEIGAGTGYWASLIAAAGGDVVAYDAKPGTNGWVDHEPYHPIAKGDASVSRRHPDRTLFLCWPPMTRMAATALRHYHGRRVAYVGESDGCTADETFRRMIDRGWTEVADVEIPTWRYIHDRLFIYKRKEGR